MDLWRTFFKIAICPYCRKKLIRRTENEISCTNCEKKFPIKNGIPYFSPNTMEFKYPILEEVDRYIATCAFVDEILNQGTSTGLYSTINDLFNYYYIKIMPKRILDAGCGPGRTTRDIALRAPWAQVFGIDISRGMLTRAKEMIIEGKTIELNLISYGWGKKKLKGVKIVNLFLLGGDVERLPFLDNSFDGC